MRYSTNISNLSGIKSQRLSQKGDQTPGGSIMGIRPSLLGFSR